MIRALFSFQINKILLISWQFWLDRQEIEGWAQMGSAGPKVSMKVSMGFHQGAGVMGLPGAQMSSEVSMDFTAIRFSGVRKVAKAELQFTHDAIRALECSAGKSEQIFYDKTQRGLALRVTARGAKTFVVIKRVNGTMKRITISKYDSKAKIVSIRDQAAKLIGEIDEIIEREKLDKQSSFVTVESTFEKMMKAKQRITQATREDYRRTFKNYLSSIADVSLGDFDYEDVIELHASITKPVLRANGTMSKERKRAANKALGLLGSIYRFAIVTSRHEGKSLITSNPVEIMREITSGMKTVEAKSGLSTTSWLALLMSVLRSAMMGLSEMSRQRLHAHLLPYSLCCLLVFVQMRLQKSGKRTLIIKCAPLFSLSAQKKTSKIRLKMVKSFILCSMILHTARFFFR